MLFFVKRAQKIPIALLAPPSDCLFENRLTDMSRLNATEESQYVTNVSSQRQNASMWNDAKDRELRSNMWRSIT
jgi:hypothetical protein